MNPPPPPPPELAGTNPFPPLPPALPNGPAVPPFEVPPSLCPPPPPEPALFVGAGDAALGPGIPGFSVGRLLFLDPPPPPPPTVTPRALLTPPFDPSSTPLLAPGAPAPPLPITIG